MSEYKIAGLHRSVFAILSCNRGLPSIKCVRYAILLLVVKYFVCISKMQPLSLEEMIAKREAEKKAQEKVSKEGYHQTQLQVEMMCCL